jgi:hypothetical protein
MPDLADDVLELPGSATSAGGVTLVGDVEMDEDIRTIMRQSFITQNKRLDFYAEQYLDQSRHVSTQSNQLFVMNSQFVGSGALNRVPSGLPQQVLEHNAAAGQPFNSPKAA